MPSLPPLWDRLAALSLSSDIWLAVLVLMGLVTLATLGTAGYQQLRRVIRTRRVARELRRVHEAAYRERFGKGRRLA